MRFQIENAIDRDFGMVPRALWRTGMTKAAKLVCAYLCCLRDGAVPYVAEIEAELQMGRDARRKAFKELESLGVIRWQVQVQNQRIVGKTLVLNVAAVAGLQLGEKSRAPENQADGASTMKTSNAPENQADGKNPRAPENPTDGKTSRLVTENRRSTDAFSGGTSKERKQESARKARECVAKKPSEGDVVTLSPFKRDHLLQGNSIVLGEGAEQRTVHPDYGEGAALVKALRQDAKGW